MWLAWGSRGTAAGNRRHSLLLGNTGSEHRATYPPNGVATPRVTAGETATTTYFDMNDETQQIEVPGDISRAAITSPFILALCRLEAGGLVLGASDDLEKAIRAVGVVGKKAEVALKVTMKPNGRSESGYDKVGITAKCKPTIPSCEPALTSLFVSTVGNVAQLLPYDPQQRELPLKLTVVKDRELKDTALPERKMK